MKVIVIVVSEIIVTKNHTERNNKKKKILTETIGDMRYRISPNKDNNVGASHMPVYHNNIISFQYYLLAKFT